MLAGISFKSIGRALATSVVVAAGGLAILAPSASGATVEAIADGGFEATTCPTANGVDCTNTNWVEDSSQAFVCRNPPCGEAPASGSGYLGLGGGTVVGTAVGSATQTITLRRAPHTLSFKLAAFAGDPDAGAQFSISIDGFPAYSETFAAPHGYAAHSVNLSLAQATPGAHTLRLTIVCFGPDFESRWCPRLNVDDISIATSVPDVPQITSTSPASPADDNTPQVRGSGAEAGSTVRFYRTANCTGTPIGVGPAADFNTAGILVTVPESATTGLHATATGSDGSTSPCSAGFAYTDTAPATPVLDTALTKTPKKKTSKRQARFEFSSTIGGATFECSLDGDGFKSCVPPRIVKIGKGRHVFQVRAISDGVADPTPATYTWKVKKKRKKG